jgi:hypothetical protein
VSIAIRDYNISVVNEAVYREALTVWEAFFIFNEAVTRGCDDNNPVAVEAHTHELDSLGAQFMAAYVEAAADSRVTVYMLIMACHIGDLVRGWDGLMNWCSQGGEEMHQVTKFFARKRSSHKDCVLGFAHPSAHDDELRAHPSRRQRERHTGKQVACTGHVSKAKREVHEQTQNVLKNKYPTHNFSEFRAGKRARGEYK